eukprot:CAMPEP_0177746216 /NCGR_PEP_ID=MMETSP0484_2-20121128/30739_1 /TAXON_ID=354590 /ORGANISM="Rhodomonas lens, Strain RHODO" /LENGTH=127 /DNA_ID=CAMNT_0019260927 /DNA_START=156 /DNA_END=536 /DNA_ORIENTATION=+
MAESENTVSWGPFGPKRNVFAMKECSAYSRTISAEQYPLRVIAVSGIAGVSFGSSILLEGKKVDSRASITGKLRGARADGVASTACMIGESTGTDGRCTTSTTRASSSLSPSFQLTDDLTRYCRVAN